MSFIYNMADTWNAIGTTFNGIYMNISNGAGGAPVGAAASRAFRLDSNGTSIFDIDISGNVSQTGFILATGSQAIIWTNGSSSIRMKATANGLNLGSTTVLNWTQSSDSNDTPDLTLRRDVANTLAQRNGTTAQKFSIYNTFTDASNYERGVIDWIAAANVMTFGPQAAGTGILRSIGFTSNTIWNIDNQFDIGANNATRPRNYYGASWVKYSVVTLASLSASFNSAASAGVGAQAFVTDLTTASFILNATAAGGGTLPGPVFSDGTQWRVG